MPDDFIDILFVRAWSDVLHYSARLNGQLYAIHGRQCVDIIFLTLHSLTLPLQQHRAPIGTTHLYTLNKTQASGRPHLGPSKVAADQPPYNVEYTGTSTLARSRSSTSRFSVQRAQLRNGAATRIAFWLRRGALCFRLSLSVQAFVHFQVTICVKIGCQAMTLHDDARPPSTPVLQHIHVIQSPGTT